MLEDLSHHLNIPEWAPYLANLSADPYSPGRSKRLGWFLVKDGEPFLQPQYSLRQSSRFNDVLGDVSRSYEPMEARFLLRSDVKELIVGFQQAWCLGPEDLINFQLQRVEAAVTIGADGRPRARRTNAVGGGQGIHRDGVECLSVTCLERENVSGGASELFLDIDGKEKILSHELKIGERLHHRDLDMFHRATDIEVIDSTRPGFRTIAIISGPLWDQACIPGTDRVLGPPRSHNSHVGRLCRSA
jgi:hypothetical protein